MRYWAIWWVIMVFVYNYKHLMLFVYYCAMCAIEGCCLFIGYYVCLYVLVGRSDACSPKSSPARVVVAYGG